MNKTSSACRGRSVSHSASLTKPDARADGRFRGGALRRMICAGRRHVDPPGEEGHFGRRHARLENQGTLRDRARALVHRKSMA